MTIKPATLITRRPGLRITLNANDAKALLSALAIAVPPDEVARAVFQRLHKALADFLAVPEVR